MGRDGGFHPFKGRVSRHFGDSVGLSCCPAEVPRRGRGDMEGKWLTTRMKLAPDDAYLSCEYSLH
jgi:hypothetical protein